MSVNLTRLLREAAPKLELEVDASGQRLVGVDHKRDPTESSTGSEDAADDGSFAEQDLHLEVGIRHSLQAGDTLRRDVVVAVRFERPLPWRFSLRERFDTEPESRLLGGAFDRAFSVTTRKRATLKKLLTGDPEDILLDVYESGREVRMTQSGIELRLVRPRSVKALTRSLDLATDLADAVLERASEL